MKLDEWAKQWNISSAAIAHLRQLWGIEYTSRTPNDLSEAGVQSVVRLEASRKGCRLWRNNVGAAYMTDGNFLRYGLANDSSNLNRQIKSADLIGIRPVRIAPHMVGMILGQFISREIKAANWRYTGTERELAQLRWAELILALGGDACFAIGEGTI